MMEPVPAAANHDGHDGHKGAYRSPHFSFCRNTSK